MGTLWGIEVPDHGHPEDARLAVEKAYKELARIEHLMSEWKPESPISQIHGAAGLHPVDVPAELTEILQRSIRYSEVTQGTFDITWRGMGNIWHFDDAFRVPSAEAVTQGKKHIDYRAIRVDGNTVYLPQGSNIGLGGIAKGYATTGPRRSSPRRDSKIHWSTAEATFSLPARAMASLGVSAFRTRAANMARFWAPQISPDWRSSLRVITSASESSTEFATTTSSTHEPDGRLPLRSL